MQFRNRGGAPGDGHCDERICATQGFAEKPQGLAVRPALVGPSGCRKVTKKVRRKIRPGTGEASFELGLNEYGRRLLKKARKTERSLPVTVVIERGSDTDSSLLTQTVVLEPNPDQNASWTPPVEPRRHGDRRR